MSQEPFQKQHYNIRHPVQAQVISLLLILQARCEDYNKFRFSFGKLYENSHFISAIYWTLMSAKIDHFENSINVNDADHYKKDFQIFNLN